MNTPLRYADQLLPGLPCPRHKNSIQCGAKRLRNVGDQPGCRIACSNKDCRATFTMTEDGWTKDTDAQQRLDRQ